MDNIIAYLGGIEIAGSRNDDDFADRLNHRFTSAILVMFSFMVTTSTLVGDQIKCWVPAHFSDSHEEYTNNYCWIRNTYWLPFEDNIPYELEEEKRHMIQYYQWIPLLLLAQALLFFLPIMLWRHQSKHSGMDMENIIIAAEEYQSAKEAQEKEESLDNIANHFSRYLERKKKGNSSCTLSLKSLFTKTCCRCCASGGGHYLVSLYLFIKFLFVVNVISQLFMLNVFLGTDYNMYGIDVLTAIVNGEDWKASRRFPRVTMCDLKVRRLGNIQRYTVQCVLPINLFNEMIYLFLWYWFVFVAIISVYSFISWCLREMFKVDRYRFIKKYLREYLRTDEDKRSFVKFVRSYLKHDGVFALRLIGENTNKIVLYEVIVTMWKRFQEEAKMLEKEKHMEEYA